MENKNSYEITNPVFNTAKMTSFFLAESGNKYAQKLIEKTQFDTELAYKENPMLKCMIVPNIIGQEVRYEAVNRIVREKGNKNILDLACGFTPRGLEFANEGYEFHGGDLQMVVPVIEPIVKELAAENADRINYSVVDVTDLNSCLAAIESIDGPVTIITEGLLPYLNEVEKKTLFTNVAAMLKKNGGCYICPDFNDNEYALRFASVLLDEEGKEAVRKTWELYSKNGDCDTEGQMMKPKDATSKIIEQLPLKYEWCELFPESEDVQAYSLIGDKERLAQLKSIIKDGLIFIAEYDPEKDTEIDNAESAENAFSISYEQTAERFSFKVSGRLDSITAPKLLERYNAEKANASFNSIEFDFSNLNYISSAGLRVLLSVKKEVAGDLIIRHANDGVKEVMRITGFDQIIVFED